MSISVEELALELINFKSSDSSDDILNSLKTKFGITNATDQTKNKLINWKRTGIGLEEVCKCLIDDTWNTYNNSYEIAKSITKSIIPSFKIDYNNMANGINPLKQTKTNGSIVFPANFKSLTTPSGGLSLRAANLLSSYCPSGILNIFEDGEISTGFYKGVGNPSKPPIAVMSLITNEFTFESCLKYVNTNQMIADLFVEALNKALYIKHLNVCSISSLSDIDDLWISMFESNGIDTRCFLHIVRNNNLLSIDWQNFIDNNIVFTEQKDKEIMLQVDLMLKTY